MSTYLAERLRDIARAPDQPERAALLEIAAIVGRQEAFLDEQIGNAQAEAIAVAWHRRASIRTQGGHL